MKTITPNDILPLVRKNFDEVVTNDSDMLETLPEDNDGNNFEEILKRVLPEAINAVHQNAPLGILDGETAMVTPIINEGVMSFTVNDDVLRLVTFKASDSDYVLADQIDEYSTRGRMQLNPYTRGTSDNPCLVKLQGRVFSGRTAYRYYSCGDNATVTRFEYIPLFKYGDATLKYADLVFDQIVDVATGMMYQIYGDGTRGDYFIKKGTFQTEESDG